MPPKKASTIDLSPAKIQPPTDSLPIVASAINHLWDAFDQSLAEKEMDRKRIPYATAYSMILAHDVCCRERMPYDTGCYSPVDEQHEPRAPGADSHQCGTQEVQQRDFMPQVVLTEDDISNISKSTL